MVKSKNANDSKNQRNKRATKRPHEKNTKENPTIMSTKQNFKGRHDNLEEYIFYTGPTQADDYIKTTRYITNYSGKTYVVTIRKLIEDLKNRLGLIPKPSPPDKDITGKM